MGRKILAVFLTVTFPIWCIPFALGYLCFMQMRDIYVGILRGLEEDI